MSVEPDTNSNDLQNECIKTILKHTSHKSVYQLRRWCNVELEKRRNNLLIPYIIAKKIDSVLVFGMLFQDDKYRCRCVQIQVSVSLWISISISIDERDRDFKYKLDDGIFWFLYKNVNDLIPKLKTYLLNKTENVIDEILNLVNHKLYLLEEILRFDEICTQ